MRCKKHVPDLSSTIGVCSSCLRERLEALVEAQAQSARVVPPAAAAAASSDYLRKPEPNPPRLNFPHSVSSYVSRRKSDSRLDRLFYSTLQVGPAISSVSCSGRTASSKKKLGKFWILSSLFRSRLNKPEISSRESCEPSSSSAASPSWFSKFLPVRRQNHVSNGFSIEDSSERGRRRCRQSDRVMSIENFSDEFDGHDRSTSAESGWSSDSSPQRRHQTPAVAPPSVRRSRLGPGKSLTSLAFCLSPLVRASPNRHWSQKGLAHELSAPVGGAHRHISTAGSFCANRSRKLVDLGRFSHNR